MTTTKHDFVEFDTHNEAISHRNERFFELVSRDPQATAHHLPNGVEVVGENYYVHMYVYEVGDHAFKYHEVYMECLV